MSLAQVGNSEKSKRERKRFRPAAEPAGDRAQLPADWRERFKLLLPTEVLQDIACRCGALDVRERKLPCVVFFWAMVLVLSQDGPVWLSSIASQVSVACILAGWEMQGRGLSKQAISDNLTRRPWGFFAAVFKYLWSCYALQVGGPWVGVESVRQLDILLVDATVLRVACGLAQRFPTYATPRSTSWAALQLHSRLAVMHGLPEVVALTTVKTDELSVEFLRQAGELVLYVFDLGYWCYALYDEIMDRRQQFLSRLQPPHKSGVRGGIELGREEAQRGRTGGGPGGSAGESDLCQGNGQRAS